MISSEAETVPFDTTIVPAEAKGMVEKWLIQVLHSTNYYKQINLV